MAKLKDVEPLLEACLRNVEQFIASAKAVLSVPGSNHIAYHLAVLSLEEDRKVHANLSRSAGSEDDFPRHPDEEVRSPLEWLEDHERKIFWAVWLPTLGATLDWRTIPACMELAKEIHLKRLHSLYFHPRFPDAQQKITGEELNRLLSLAELRLTMEQAKEYRELSDVDKADLQWFFAASRDPH